MSSKIRTPSRFARFDITRVVLPDFGQHALTSEFQVNAPFKCCGHATKKDHHSRLKLFQNWPLIHNCYIVRARYPNFYSSLYRFLFYSYLYSWANFTKSPYLVIFVRGGAVTNKPPFEGGMGAGSTLTPAAGKKNLKEREIFLKNAGQCNAPFSARIYHSS